MLPYAETVLAARAAAEHWAALATIGRVVAEPGAANAISSAVSAWLDARAPDEATLEQLVLGHLGRGPVRCQPARRRRSRRRRESVTPLVSFDKGLRDRLVGVLGAAGFRGTGARDRCRA